MLLKKLRVNNRYSQLEIAELLDVSIPRYRRIETSNDFGQLTLKQAVLLSKLFNISTDEFLAHTSTVDVNLEELQKKWTQKRLNKNMVEVTNHEN